MKLSKEQVEQALERLLKANGSYSDPFGKESRPITKLCQDWLELQAENELLKAELDSWRSGQEHEFTDRDKLKAENGRLREGLMLAEKELLCFIEQQPEGSFENDVNSAVAMAFGYIREALSNPGEAWGKAGGV